MLAILRRLFGGARSKAVNDRPGPLQLRSIGPEAVETQAPAGPELVRPPADDAAPTPLVHRVIDDDLDDEDGDDEAGVEEAEDDADEDDADDPTIGRLEPLQISLPDVGEVELARTEAERVALSAPQKVTPNDPAGPGSLAETLTRLEARGLVRSRIVDDEDGGFCILYEPMGPATA